MKKLKRILRYNLCIGCGICEDLGYEYGIKMEVKENGFIAPNLNNIILKKEFDRKIYQACPAVNMPKNDSTSIWGTIKSTKVGWSTSSEIRFSSSSGGVVTSLAIYLLESKKVDAILQIGKNQNHYLFNELRLSKTRDEVISCASSRYAPSSTFNNITQLLKADYTTFAFIGKPCDISALKDYLKEETNLLKKIKYFIAIFCAGMPSYNATIKLISESKSESFPQSVKYRGDGWPGLFTVNFKDGSRYIKNYEESWGKTLGRNIHYRCKICPDGTGIYADISVGDAWDTSDGYPDFEEKEGRSFILSRTQIGESLLHDTEKEGYINTENVDIDNINVSQPYQYQRHLTSGYKLFSIYLLTFGFIKVKNFNFKNYSIFKGVKISLGSAKRFIQNILQKK